MSGGFDAMLWESCVGDSRPAKEGGISAVLKIRLLALTLPCNEYGSTYLLKYLSTYK